MSGRVARLALVAVSCSVSDADRVAKAKRRRETFAEIVERVKEQPQPAVAPAPSGYHGDCWVDPEGRRYELVNAALVPTQARDLVKTGAGVVYDACGCGGSPGCGLEWLTREDVARLGNEPPPVLHPRKHSLAELQLWRGESGHSLIVAVDNVTWGDRIGR